MDIKRHDSGTGKKDICAQAARLGDMLLQSAEYRQYLEAKQKLQCNREQSYILSQLRQQQMNLRLAQLLGEDLDDAEDDFEHLFATFCLEPIISDFLYAEGRLGRLIAEVQQIFGDKLELWSENEALNRAVKRDLN